MKKIRKDQEEALQSPEGSKVLVAGLNQEISRLNKETLSLKETIVTTQNELEVWRRKYHAADKDNGILQYKVQFFYFIETVKYLLSAVITSFGINLVSSGNNQGWYYVLLASLLYLLLAIQQKK